MNWQDASSLRNTGETEGFSWLVSKSSSDFCTGNPAAFSLLLVWFSCLAAASDDALEQICALKADVTELIDILHKHSIKVPVHIQERIQLDAPLE